MVCISELFISMAIPFLCRNDFLLKMLGLAGASGILTLPFSLIFCPMARLFWCGMYAEILVFSMILGPCRTFIVASEFRLLFDFGMLWTIPSISIFSPSRRVALCWLVS